MNNNRRFSPQVKQVISRSRSEAVRLGHGFIGTEHLLLGLLTDNDSMALRVLESLEVDPGELRNTVVESIHRIPASGNTSLNVGNLPLNKQAEKVLKVTFLEAKMLKSEEISPEHLLLSILKDKDNPASKILGQYDVDYDLFKAELEYVKQEQDFTSGTDPYTRASSDQEEPYEEEEGTRLRSDGCSRNKNRCNPGSHNVTQL